MGTGNWAYSHLMYAAMPLSTVSRAAKTLKELGFIEREGSAKYCQGLTRSLLG